MGGFRRLTSSYPFLVSGWHSKSETAISYLMPGTDSLHDKLYNYYIKRKLIASPKMLLLMAMTELTNSIIEITLINKD